jgi:ATP-dependent protease ClpP protease subunit
LCLNHLDIVLRRELTKQMMINDKVRSILESLLKLKEPEILLRGKVDDCMEDYVFWALAYLTSVNSPDVVIKIDSA